METRVALIADLLEESWPSMDLVAEELSRKVESRKSKVEIAERSDWRDETGTVKIEEDVKTPHSQIRNPHFSIELVRPVMTRRFSKAGQFSGRGYTADRLLNRFLDYPRFLRSGSAKEYDLFHLADHSYSQLVHALPADRTVVTCHDVDTFRCLWEPGGGGRGRLFHAMTRRILTGMQKAAHVACDSRATQAELVDRGVIDATKTSVVPLGLRPGLLDKVDATVEERVTGLLNSGTGGTIDLLHVGSTIARKRIDVLLEVFGKVRMSHPMVRLLRVGGRFTDQQQAQVARLGLESSIVVLPFLSVAELGEVYRRAALVLLPSDAEGFGFPVIEAMACGTPIVASDLPVLREVGGLVAEYARVAEVDDWVDQIESLLRERSEQPERWEKRRVACREQGQKFTWEETRRKMADIYDEVVQKVESAESRK